MLNKLYLWIFLVAFTTVNAQELNCNIIVNAEQIQVSNSRIFKTLENSLTELVNETKWTDIEFKEHERIKCAISILITEQSGTNNFVGTIQVQASRPVFNSTYYSPILNHKDNSFTFKYTEFEPLNYNPNGFESNLISVLSFYSNTIIGLYLDSFKVDGGDKYLKTALTIANQAQQSGSVGWDNTRTKVTRFTLVDQLTTPSNEAFRKIFYNYHYECLDSFERNQKSSAQKMLNTLLSIKSIYDSNPNNLLIRMLMDAKADEIVSVFGKDRGIKTSELISVLKRVSSINSKKWKKIYSN